jgi:Spy/CpxP family protein refolding chaperone
MMGVAEEGLNLSDDQKAKIAKIKLAQQSKMVDLRAEMVTQRAKAAKLIIAEKFDPAAVAQTTDKIAKIHADMARAHIEHLRQVRDQLTEEQRVTFDRHVLAGKMPGGGGPGGPMSGHKGRHCW